MYKQRGNAVEILHGNGQLQNCFGEGGSGEGRSSNCLSGPVSVLFSEVLLAFDNSEVLCHDGVNIDKFSCTKKHSVSFKFME